MVQPTLLPVTERILRTIETSLEGISTHSTDEEYWNDVRYVRRFQGGETTASAFPAIFITIIGVEIADDLTSDVHSLNTEDLRLFLEAWIETRSDVPEEMQKMMRDIRTAIMRDPRRTDPATSKPLAIHTRIESARYVYSENVSEPIATIEIELAVRYRTDVDDLEQAH